MEGKSSFLIFSFSWFDSKSVLIDFISFMVFFSGIWKLSFSNNYILMLISLEMMVFGVFLKVIELGWTLLNIHFFSTILVFSVLEGVMGLVILVSMFSNSNILSKGLNQMMV